MSANRKLLSEIQQVLKKVEEGVAVFDEIWEKVYAAEQQSLKEKYEGELKKEIKKLQRFRDQIKTWTGSNDIKDKSQLIDARKTIESKMEQFKICEKDTKTKAYSKEGLAREAKLNPQDVLKEEKLTWVNECLDSLHDLINTVEIEREKVTSAKGNKAKNRELLEKIDNRVQKHNWHIAKLELIIKLIDSDELDPALLDAVQDSVDYYIESAVDDDGEIGVEDEFDIYEELELDSLGCGTTFDASPRTIVPPSTKDESDVHASSDTTHVADTSAMDAVINKKNPVAKSAGKANSNTGMSMVAPPKALGVDSNVGKKANAVSSTIAGKPATIGQQKATPKQQQQKDTNETAQLVADKSGVDGSQPQDTNKEKDEIDDKTSAAGKLSTVASDTKPTTKPTPTNGLSWAHAAGTQSAGAVSATQPALSPIQLPVVGSNEQLSAASGTVIDTNKSPSLQTQSTVAPPPPPLVGGAVALSTVAVDDDRKLSSAQNNNNNVPVVTNVPNVASSGATAATATIPTTQPLAAPAQSVPNAPPLQPIQPRMTPEMTSTLQLLKQSMIHTPETLEIDKQASLLNYSPRNYYAHSHSSYPTSPLFGNQSEMVALFERLPMDSLFFVFYFQQGTYQQHLAATQLKKHSWRFHKKYMTWFQRHEEPKTAKEDYEEGTYVYFDYESGWCQRIKSEFKFEYAYLEDELGGSSSHNASATGGMSDSTNSK